MLAAAPVLLEDHPGGQFSYMSAAVDLSDPDAQGRRLLVTHYVTAQCASTWMLTAWSVYRFDPPAAAERLFSASHNFWLGNDGPDFVLKPDELIVQFLDSSIDPDVHNRTAIRRYSFSAGVRRLDPIALQPQDFVEEWLTRPWAEMQSRSAPETQASHRRLHADSLLAEYAAVFPCTASDRWLIGLDILRIGAKKRSKPVARWFVVRDLGTFQYRLESVASSRPSGCPGDSIETVAGFASDRHPLLSTAELKALH